MLLLSLKGGDSCRDLGLVARAIDDRRALLVDFDTLGTAQIGDGGLSSCVPVSSVTTVPPVRMAISSIMAERQSAKLGALTAAAFSTPRMLLTTKV